MGCSPPRGIYLKCVFHSSQRRLLPASSSKQQTRLSAPAVCRGPAHVAALQKFRDVSCTAAAPIGYTLMCLCYYCSSPHTNRQETQTAPGGPTHHTKSHQMSAALACPPADVIMSRFTEKLRDLRQRVASHSQPWRRISRPMDALTPVV